MLLDYDMSSMSTDIWSLGCIFAAMLYRKTIFFTGEDNTGQILEIAKVYTITTTVAVYSMLYTLINCPLFFIDIRNRRITRIQSEV